MLTTPNNRTTFAVFFLLLVLNNQHRHRHRHHVMALVCLHPLTASSQLRLQTLERMRGSTSQSTAAAAAGGSSWLLGCTRTTMASKQEQPQQHTPALSLLGDGASYSNMSTEAAGSHDDFWPAAVEKFLSNLEHATTRTAWLKLSPEFFDLFQQRAAEYRSSSSSSSADDPYGPRWAIANTGIDLSGTWIPIVTSDFQQAFDSFLSTCCGHFYPYFRRKIMVNFLGMTKEVIQQHQMGRTLEIVSSNPVGQWNRTLVTSGTSSSRKGGRTNRSTTTNGTDVMFFVPIYQTVQDPEGDMVEIEAWWENGGTVHRSWLRGIPTATSSNTNHKDKDKNKVKANGIFESRRYLESRNVLVCESTFHPSTTASRSIQMARVVWRYSRAN